ncbi:MlaD family protein [Acidomonas methanolica]|uniref:MlaD family protein n=1 Tax=Acidomonas methanolica TaxID=437 RepID=UPI00211A077F|nr:MlaD family protein [Acidomonas methanolica]MCQ9154215.1 MCE family protein [Acidomonas methanolica]
MKKETLVGAFVLGGVALLMAAFVLFGRFHPFEHKLYATLIFEGASSGLTVGSPVTFRGVQVGTVDKVSIEYDPPTRRAYIPVHITLQSTNISLTDGRKSTFPTIPELVAQGLRGEMNVKSFVTGSSEINLDFAPQIPAVLHPDLVSGDEIPTRQSTMQQMTQTLTQLPLRQLADNADKTLASLRALSDRMDTSLPQLVDSLRETSDHTRRMMDTANATLATLQPELTRTLETIDRLAAAGTAQMNGRGAQLSALLARADTMLRKADHSLDGITSLTSPRSPERADLEASLRDIAAAAAALRGFASDVERNPQLLLTGRHP